MPSRETRRCGLQSTAESSYRYAYAPSVADGARFGHMSPIRKRPSTHTFSIRRESLEKEKEMLVDIQIAKPQTAYKRDRLSRSFKSARRTRKPTTPRAWWTRARKPSLA